MSDVITVALIAAAPPTMTALVALLVALRTKAAIADVHVELNHRLSQLLETTGQVEHAAGVTQERERSEAQARHEGR
jgi:hypothetical protein